MNHEMEAIRCAIVRGGTSKGIFLMKNDLPSDPDRRDNVIRAIFGVPDVREIDGLGGADVLTSKLAIIGPSTRPDADVDYTFGQVSFETGYIDYKGNCGNISSAVGPFAIDSGIVAAVEPVTTVRIHLTNTGNIIKADVSVKEGKARVEGDFAIDGVPGTGSRITIDWHDVVGGTTGKLLPTGNPKDTLHVEGRDYSVTLVDAGNPTVFIEASALGILGTETPAEIEANKHLMDTVEKIRSKAAVIFGLVGKEEDATTKSPYNPFFAIVSSPADYRTYNGKEVKAEDTDIASRLLFMLHMHKTYPITGTVCTGAAARIPGSIVWNVMRESARREITLRIGHPGGVIPVESQAVSENGEIRFERIGVYRTARILMDGYVYVRKSVFRD
jgi:2-methylaconitate cis-trans-isomerase PrpF